MGALDNILESTGLLLPEFVLGVGFLLVLILGIIPNANRKTILAGGFIVALSTLWLSFDQVSEPDRVFNIFLGDLHLTHELVWFKVICDFTVIGVILFDFVIKKDVELERVLLYLSGLLGAHVMIMSTDLLVLYVSIELLSLSLYGLVYLSNTKFFAEGAVKYLVYGIVVSGITSYGLSIIFLYTGDLSYDAILADHVQLKDSLFLLAGVFLTCAGVLFKLGAVPFHFWLPDVYKSSDEPVLVYISLIPKFAAIVVLWNIIQYTGLGVSYWPITLEVIIIASLVMGTLAALLQNSFKKMMAYSSIAQAGFLIMALIPAMNGVDGGFMTLSFYMVMMLFSTWVAFMASFQLKFDSYSDVKVASDKMILQKVIFGAALVSLIGLPPAIGFSAKFNLFSTYLNVYAGDFSNLQLTVVSIAFLATVISMVFYLKPLYLLLVKKQLNKIEFNVSYEAKILLVLITAPLLLGFVFWGQLLEMLRIFTSI